jgi:extracellular elastinolytic metalloproteinase
MRDSEVFAAAEGHARAMDADIQLDPHVQKTLAGYVVHAQQQVHGLSLYPHSFVIRIAESGRVSLAGNEIVKVGEVDRVPTIGAQMAALAAYRHLREGTSERCHTPHEPLFERGRYRPRVVSAFPMPNRPTVVSAGPFSAPVQADLVVFSSDKPALAWLVSAAVAGVAHFTLIIRASGDAAGELLYCAKEAASVCRADVYLFSPDEPRATVEFPRPLDEYPPGFGPPAFLGWLDKDQTVGNNVTMKLGNKDRFVRAVPDGADLRFVTTPLSDDDKIVNAFFVCNFMHDFFSRIGFGEDDRNFQQQNFSGTGLAGDRLKVFVVSTTQGNANMVAQNDGETAELSLGVWKNFLDKPPTLGNHTAFDSEVIMHEYSHGVSQRLVGGPLKKSALVEPQSLALGEAWSDYFAITIQNYYRGNTPRYTFASYASKKPNGVRAMPYGPHFTADIRQLGTPPFDEQHGAGSIFAAALIATHETLRDLFGDDNQTSAEGQETCWRLVVDSMKNLQANPNFIDARDAMLAAIAPSPRAADIARTIRETFVKFGMGTDARSNGTSLKGFQPGFTA